MSYLIAIEHRGYGSCGCEKREQTIQRFTKHGHSSNGILTRTYNSWRKMKERCLNFEAINFDDYGGRGITVCERWMQFENFLADMGERPEGKTLDRYPDNDGNYEPGNVRWATPKEQYANRRQSYAA